MNSVVLTCSECSTSFRVLAKEQENLHKVAPSLNGALFELPLPKQCPACREQNRLAYRNEWSMYRRTCNASGKDLISIYHHNSPYLIFDPAYWWSDAYDPLYYGRSFDFSRAFFPQFNELNLSVPKAAIQNAKSENSQYTNYSAENKNCYLCVGTGQCEDCYYCARTFKSKFVVDSYDMLSCENCYECVHCANLYGGLHCANCYESSELMYCENCRGCKNCFGCADLERKSFCLFNEQLTESEYRERVATIQEKGGIAERRIHSSRENYCINSEDSTGNHLLNCSRCESCFSLKESQDCLYGGSGTENRDAVDCNFFDNNELMYFATNLHADYRVMFAALVWYTSESLYVLNCFHSSSLFGCTGMKRNQYCILNKQYSRTDYEALVPKIIQHMRETGEWGRYFPLENSPFPYNNSVAHEYYPMTKEGASTRGLLWLDEEESSEQSKTGSLPTGVARCVVSGKPFNITKQERELYGRLGVPLPVKSPLVRRSKRMQGVKAAMRWYR